MSEMREYVAECPLCGTKFTDNPGACPICGAAPLKPIRETVATERPIPLPSRRTLPPTAMRKHTKTSLPAPRTPIPAATRMAKERHLPPRGPDGRFRPYARTAPAMPRPTRTLEEAREIRRKELAPLAARIEALKAARKPKSPLRRVIRWLEEVFV